MSPSTPSPASVQRARELEALLFWKAEPVAKTDLTKLLNCTDDELTAASTLLAEQYAAKERGIMFIQSPTSLVLATAPAVAPLIKKLEADEYSATLGKATLETLALIVYKHPISRADIEHIRGVQSTYSLRTLLMRGLIEKTGKQGFEYQPTAACLAYMGIENIENIPERAALIEHIQNITAHRAS